MYGLENFTTGMREGVAMFPEPSRLAPSFVTAQVAPMSLGPFADSESRMSPTIRVWMQ